MRDFIARHVVAAYVTDDAGAPTAVDIVDHLGQTLLDEPPAAPEIIGTIMDRTYTVGSGPYLIDLATKFSGATSYLVVPMPDGVTLDGATLFIDPVAPLEATAISVRGAANGRQSDPLTFYLTVEAVVPEPTAPAAPVLTLVDKTAESITVSWLEPADGGSPITGYRLYVDGTLAISNATSPQSVTLLTPETPYSLTLIATNTVGDSLPSAPLVVTTDAVGAPEIVSPPEIVGQPLVGQPLGILPPLVSGEAVLAYQWYDGDPAAGGEAISGWDALDQTPGVADYGADLWLRVMASNAGGSAQVDVLAGRVGAVFADDWSDFAVGDTLGQLLTSYGRNNYIGAGVVADVDAPAGQTLRVRADNSQTCFVYGSAASTFGAAQAADTTRTQALYLFRHIGANSGRYHLRFANAALTGFAPGVMVHTGNLRLQIDTDNINDTDGSTLATLTAGTLYWLRLEQEGVNIRAKLWADGAGEPAEFLSRVCTTAVTPPVPAFGTRYATAFPADQYDLLYWSAGYNADAPWPAGHEPPAFVSSDQMKFAAATPQSSFAQGDGMITWNFEDI